MPGGTNKTLSMQKVCKQSSSFMPSPSAQFPSARVIEDVMKLVSENTPLSSKSSKICPEGGVNGVGLREAEMGIY